MNPNLLWLIPSFFVVAFLYASVGHGGASGYLALLSLLAMAPQEMATSALCLNLLVSGLAFWAFWKRGYFSRRLTAPFVAASVPASFVGGMWHVSLPLYRTLLAIVLLFAAFRLTVQVPGAERPSRLVPGLSITLPFGAAIGLLSGVVGIGGGIFLSPILYLKNWADPKRIAATSSVFIFVNSVAGLLGRLFGSQLQFGGTLLLVIPAFLGAWAGSHLGANHFSGLMLRRALALVLVVAALKLMFARSG